MNPAATALFCGSCCSNGARRLGSRPHKTQAFSPLSQLGRGVGGEGANSQNTYSQSALAEIIPNFTDGLARLVSIRNQVLNEHSGPHRRLMSLIPVIPHSGFHHQGNRSEERRVGKERRSRRTAYHRKKKRE